TIDNTYPDAAAKGSQCFEDFAHVHVLRDEVPDEGDLLGVIRPRFHGEIVDFRSHRITVFVGQQDGEGHPADDFEDVRTGPKLAGQHDARELGTAFRAHIRGGRQEDVLTVAGSDEKHAALEMAHGVVDSHGAYDH